jgi:4-amino-4-deoxychorismate lyase
MCQFIESIKIVDGSPINLNYHNERLNRTRRHFWKSKAIKLREYVNPQKRQGIYKARVVYGENGIEQIAYIPYKMRKICDLRIITTAIVNYPYKSVDRSGITKLLEDKGHSDDILIIKNGLISDTSFTNVALYDGETWYTPKHPLLKGTKRAYLIDKNIISEKDIHMEELFNYKAIRLFNAMIEFGDIEIPINETTITQKERSGYMTRRKKRE